ncbi:MAG: FAD-linked oxidase [Bacteroidetes bacterium]|nr:MAG: FAD-linked oxidase [Bacteroidota bacterium]
MPINLPEGISKLPITAWQNGHQNFTHNFKPDCSFKLTIPDSPPDSAAKYLATTANFQWLIQYAIDNNIQLRALGNGWSFSQVGVCEGGLVDTKSLRLSFKLSDSFVSQDYLDTGHESGDLFLTQCGMSILMLNEKLENDANPKRSLKASGASNGQSIAGATSTGTHGSAFKVGAVHDTIRGLHIVVGPHRHVWIEKKSNPIVSDAFMNWLGAELIRDDDIFNAAVVSFGSFGFIHGILIETEPIFLLEEQRAASVLYDDSLIKAINNLDFSEFGIKLPFPPEGPDKELYHFEVLVNPHQFEPGNPDKGVYLKTMYKIPYRSDYPKRVRDDQGFTYGENTLGVIETILDTLGTGISDILVPPLVNKLFPLAFKASGDAFGTVGETFNNPKFRGKAASAAIAVDSSNASHVLEEIIAINHETPFPGGLAMRYVKGTSAILGFTHFELSCIMELDGVDSDVSRRFFSKIWERLEELAIPYTLHWGKFNFNLNPGRVRQMYGDVAVDKWIACRNKLLDADSKKVFTNNFIQSIGLDG